jgi:hypothetical protein
MPAVATEDAEAGSLRAAVLGGPGSPVTAETAGGVLEALICPGLLAGAVAAAGHRDVRRRSLPAAMTAGAVLGLCLFSGLGYDGVLSRVWPVTAGLRPGGGAGSADVASGPALSQARARLSPKVLQEVFRAHAARPDHARELRVFGLVATAVDGPVFDLAAEDAVAQRYAIPSGGSCPQARVVTLVGCGTRRVLAAEQDSYAVSEQALWDRMVTALTPGMINFADRNFFSTDRFRRAAATGAHLVWRVKNGKKSLPAKVIAALPDGSYLVRLRESDAMRARRRKTTGDPRATRLDDITARLIEFTVTITDEAGRTHTSRFRVLTTLTDHNAYPATQIAQAYTLRWQVELTYKTIKSTLRGPGRRLRGRTADLAEQEIWGLLAVYNALVDLAIETATTLGIDRTTISFTVILHAVRDHLMAATQRGDGCPRCGHLDLPDRADLIAAIAAGPRNRTSRTRTGPRTAKERRTQHTRKAFYTTEITTTTLPKADIRS